MAPVNASSLLSMADVDGGLIGRCALSTDEFSQICIEACKVDQICLID